MALTFLTIFLLPLMLYMVLLWFMKKKQNNNLVPSPPQLPIIGNLHQLGDLPHRNLWKLSKKYGPIMRLKLGSIPCIVISSAEAAKKVLKDHDRESCSRPCLAGVRKLTYDFLDVGFSPYSDHWRQIRKLCVLEVFSLKRVQSFGRIREEEVAILVNSISQAASSSTPVNLTSKIFKLSGSIIFRLAFGTSFNGSGFDQGEFHELMHDLSSTVGTFSAEDFFPSFGWIIDKLTGQAAKIQNVYDRLDSFFEDVISAHLDPERAKQGDIIDVLLEVQKEQSESNGNTAWLTRKPIKGILLNMFFGGIDTSALAVIWAMTSLARNPRVMKKVQEEIRSHVGSKKGRVTEGDIEQLEYFKAVIKETLRLHSFVPLLILRETLSHFKLDHYDIFPKTVIIVNAWGISRDPSSWKSPEEFLPERFIENPMDFMGRNYEYLPFGEGRRSCAGMNMGLATTQLALANLLYCYDWKLPEGMKEKDIDTGERAGTTLSKKIPLELVPVKFLK